MPYSNIYLQYVENRVEALEEDSEPGYDRDPDDEYDDDVDEDHSFTDIDRVFVEFTPIKLTAEEPRGESLELELDFEVSLGDTLHLILVRFNSYSDGVFDDWCIESVYTNLEEAEDRAEAIEELTSAAECADERANEPIVLKAEVISFPLIKK